MDWTVSRSGPVTTDLRITFRKSSDWEQWGLISADRHLDNPHTDIELQKLHLEQAKERGAFVLDHGDLFDAMQGKSDRRSSKQDLLARFAAMGIDPEDENASKAYLNSLVRYAADFFEPYVENIALISKGNHESSVANKVEYDLTDGLVYDLNQRGGTQIVRGGFRGWIRFLFQNDVGGLRMSRRAYYHHGYGGGGPVTKGVIQANRMAVYLANADYVWGGHIHEEWMFPIQRIRLTDSGKEVVEKQYHVRLPTYKEEFVNIADGFHHEKGGPPKPLGAWWVRFYWSARKGTIETQFIPAEV